MSACAQNECAAHGTVVWCKVMIRQARDRIIELGPDVGASKESLLELVRKLEEALDVHLDGLGSGWNESLELARQEGRNEMAEALQESRSARITAELRLDNARHILHRLQSLIAESEL